MDYFIPNDITANMEENMERRNLTIYVNNDELAQIEVIRKRHLRRTYADTLRFLIAQEAEKILSNNGLTQQPQQPQPPQPPSPPARHVPTVAEVLAMRKPEASEACWEFWGDWTEEQRRALIGPLEINRSVLDERFGLSPDDEPYGDD